MSAQLIITGLVVILASCYLVRRGWRAWSGPNPGCSGACNCDVKRRRESEREPGSGLILIDKIDLRRDYPNQNI